MLAEKFILVIEALIRSAQYPDGSYRAESHSPHVPIKLPTKKRRHGAAATGAAADGFAAWR
jgi:hypothetical protein